MKKNIGLVILTSLILIVLSWCGDWSSAYHSELSYQAIYDIRYLYALLVGIALLICLRLSITLSTMMISLVISGLICIPWIGSWTYPASLFLGLGIYQRFSFAFNDRAVWISVLVILLLNGLCEYYAAVLPTYWLMDPQRIPPTAAQLFLLSRGLRMVGMLFCGYAVGLFRKVFSTSVLPALGLFIASLILGEALRGVVMRSSFFFAYSWQGSIALALALLLDRLLDALRLRHVKGNRA